MIQGLAGAQKFWQIGQGTMDALNPDKGCFCLTQVPESSICGYVEASKLFIGHGPIQLCWNYNYVDDGATLGCVFS